jgi:hypothetical protein
MKQQTKPIQANQYWNDTGVHLAKDAHYRMSVVVGTGAPLRDASFEARSIEGEDWQSLAHKTAELVHGKRVDEAKWFALIGTIDKKYPWVITDGGIVTAPASGALVCFFNDVQFEVFYKNNSGWVTLDVEQVMSL